MWFSSPVKAAHSDNSWCSVKSSTEGSATKKLSQENTHVLVQKVQNCHERIYGTVNLISLGGDNILGYCAALVLRALLPNERDGSVTLGEEPNRTSSQLQGQSSNGKGIPTSLFLIHCTATCGYTWNGKKKKKAIFSCLRELHQSQIGLHIHKKTL